MKLVFFGTSGAVTTGRDGNVRFAVSYAERLVLVEASGSPAGDFDRAGLELESLEAVVVSHGHPDHLYAFPALVQSLRLLGRRSPLVVLANPPTVRLLRRLVRLLGLEGRSGMYPIRWLGVRDGEHRLGSGLVVRLFPVRHSRPTSGVRLATPEGCLAYSADTAPCPRLVQEARGCSALIHEATCGIEQEAEKNPEGHSSGRQAGLAAAQAGVGTLFLCHFDYTGAATPEAMASEARGVFGGQAIVPEPSIPYRV